MNIFFWSSAINFVAKTTLLFPFQNHLESHYPQKILVFPQKNFILDTCLTCLQNFQHVYVFTRRLKNYARVLTQSILSLEESAKAYYFGENREENVL